MIAVDKGSHRGGESPSPEVEMVTTRNFPLRRGVLHTQQLGCGMWLRNEHRAGELSGRLRIFGVSGSWPT